MGSIGVGKEKGRQGIAGIETYRQMDGTIT